MIKRNTVQETKTERIQMRATKEEFHALVKNAERAGMSLSAFLLQRGLHKDTCDISILRNLGCLLCELHAAKKYLPADIWNEIEERSGELWQSIR